MGINTNKTYRLICKGNASATHIYPFKWTGQMRAQFNTYRWCAMDMPMLFACIVQIQWKNGTASQYISFICNSFAFSFAVAMELNKSSHLVHAVRAQLIPLRYSTISVNICEMGPTPWIMKPQLDFSGQHLATHEQPKAYLGRHVD